jgi:alkylated DNA repair dioxygenase AlkB
MERSHSIPGVVYYAPETAQLPYMFPELARFCAEKGSQRLTISGAKGPLVRAYVPLAKDAALPACLDVLWRKAVDLGIVSDKDRVFQVSVNLYKASDLMVPHKDGRGTRALIFSFGNGCSTLRFFHRPSDSSATYTRVFGEPAAGEDVRDYLLESGSVVLVGGAGFTDWVHYVEQRESDTWTAAMGNCDAAKEGLTVARDTRVSVVFWPHWKE